MATMGVVAAMTSMYAPPATAAVSAITPIVLDFESEAAGGKPNGFSPTGFPDVTFSDTIGSDLEVNDFGSQSKGQGLAVFSDDASALSIGLARPTNGISMAYGNDDPNFSADGDLAVLTLYRGTTQVARVTQKLNRNDVMDQTITYSGDALFNRAVFHYDVSVGAGLIEIVDNIRINALCTVIGTESNDVLTGTAGSDHVCGGGGNDNVDGLGGNDLVSGGRGDDTVSGGLGNDNVLGGSGVDVVIGSGGADTLYGGPGNDRLDGGGGTDRCDGGLNTDTGVRCEISQRIP